MAAEYLQSILLSEAGFRHAFFTRRGGVSDGPYASLNFSISVGDTPENVAQNCELAARALDVSRSAIFFASQVHGNAVREVRAGDAVEQVLHECCDALVTSAEGIGCAVRTADCVPILIADCLSGAVASVHAGWRGVVCGVVARAVEHLRSTSARSELIAAIGPHLSGAAFEVSEDVAEQIARAADDGAIIDRSRGVRPYVDLRRAVRSQLRMLDITEGAIDDVFGCTYRDSARFFSYRRDGAKSGRHLSVIVARAASNPFK